MSDQPVVRANGARRASKLFPRRAVRLASAACAVLLSVGALGFIGAASASAVTITGAATGAPAIGSLIIADLGGGSTPSNVYETLPGSSTELTVGSSVDDPYDVATDSAGDVFIANVYSTRIEEFSAFGVDSEIGQGNFSEPAGVAIDGAGDLFVSDYGNARVVEIPAGTNTEVTIASGFYPWGIASDQAGNVFVADQSNNSIVEIPAGGGTPVTIATNVIDPYGLAVDSNNDLYVALDNSTTNVDSVVEIPAGSNSQIPIENTLAAYSVTEDQSGDLYIPDMNSGNVDEYPAGGGSPSVVASGFPSPVAVAVYPPVDAATPLVVNVTGTGLYGGAFVYTATYSGFTNGDTASVVTGTLSCQTAYSEENAPTPVGLNPLLSCSGLSAPSKYQLVYQLGDIQIAPVPLLITPVTSTMTYGTVPTITAGYTGFVQYDSAASLTTLPTCTTTATATAIVGSVFSTSCGGAADPNYTISYAPSTITVKPAPLVVNGPSIAMTYGGSVPALTPTYSGFVNNQTSSVLTAQPSCSTLATGTSSVGNYAVTCSGATAANYSITYNPGTVDVAAAPLSVAASSGSMTYGGTVPSITPSYSGFVNGQSASVFTTAPTCSTLATLTSAVGAYASSCSGGVAPNYSITYTPGSVVVGPHVLTISASSASMTYGGTVPTITPTYSGFVNNQSASSLTTQPTCTAVGTSKSGVGSYATSCTGAVDSNYTISYVPGSLTISTAPLVVTASSTSMSFGGTVPSITPSYSGFEAGDTASSLTTQPTCSTLATVLSVIGSYASSCSGAVDPNYSITYVAGTVTVSVATLTITASSAQMTYGGTPPTVTASYVGFVGSNTVASLTKLPTCTTVATAKSAAGTYATSCTGATDANYLIAYVPGVLTVTPAALTITASSATIAQGGATPTITPSYSGFENGDTSTSLTTQPTCATTAGPTSAAGTYASTCSGAVDPNYTITYVAGSVHVGSVSVVVSANNVSKLFGAAIPTLTAAISGLPSGVTLASSGITGTPVCTTSATASSPAGSYPITCSKGTLSSSTYSFTFVPGTLTVGFSSSCINYWYLGNVNVGSGQAVCVGADALIIGGVNVASGGAADVESSAVLSSIDAQGASALRVCSSAVGGAVIAQNSTGLVTVGDTNRSCAGSIILGGVTATGNKAGVEVADNDLFGPTNISNNSGSLAFPESGSTYTVGNI